MTAKVLVAELIGTFVIVLVTVAAYLAMPPPAGTSGIALAAGLSLAAMTGALGHLSGGHFNPAVTVGLVAAGKTDPSRLVGYIVAQVLGAIAAVYLLQAILGGLPGLGAQRSPVHAVFTAASNTYVEARGISLASAMVAEGVATAILVLGIAGAASRQAPAGFAPLAAGIALAALTIGLMPITNASLNPARSTGPALLAGGLAMSQLWAFWTATIAGGVLGGAIARWLFDER